MGMEQLIILRGISGAGKTTFVSMLREAEPHLVHASADFIHEKDGVYTFNPAKLSEGHGQCFRTAIHAMQERAKMVVVDNTNTMNWEMAPYVLAGQAFGYKTAIVRLEIDVKTGVERNVHNVPEKSVRSMSDRFQNPMNFWPPEYRLTNPTKKQVWDLYRYSEFK